MDKEQEYEVRDIYAVPQTTQDIPQTNITIQSQSSIDTVSNVINRSVSDALASSNYKSGVSGWFLGKNGSVFLPTTTITINDNSASAITGIKFNLVNAGAGLENAFSFSGSEYVSAAVGGTQDKKIRVLIGGTTYYIPAHTA